MLNSKIILLSLLFLILFSSNIRGQNTDFQYPDFTSRNPQAVEGRWVEIDLTQLKAGYWHAENTSDSIYLKIDDTKCYYNEMASRPYKAHLRAQWLRLSVDKPQQIIEENTIDIEFTNLNTLPEPRYSSSYYPPLRPDVSFLHDETRVHECVFMRLLPNLLIIQEKDSLKRILTFHKLFSEQPLAYQKQIDSLKRIENKLIGRWKSTHKEEYWIFGKGSLDLKYHGMALNFIPFFIKEKNETLLLNKHYMNIVWNNDSEYLTKLPFNNNPYSFFPEINNNFIVFRNDSLNLYEKLVRIPSETFPDSILNKLINKVWCDTVIELDSARIDTFLFDFGIDKEPYKSVGEFVESKGYSYNTSSFHAFISFDFFRIKEHYYFQEISHGGIYIWEILEVLEDKLVLREIKENGYSAPRTFFLHPQSKEFFSNGYRIRF